MPNTSSKIIFLDRDGTLNYDPGYFHQPKEVRLLEGVVPGLKLLEEHYRFVVISNQSGIARGYHGHEDVLRVNTRINELLGEHDLKIERFYYCPHSPDENCACRKPRPEMLLKAAEELGGDCKVSWMIGDKPSDIGAGKAAGARTIFLTCHCLEAEVDPDFTAADLTQAAEIILGEDGYR
ncbi:MAG: HAD family hydrolase [Planctomycetes bacterium]|nr:HAD family hydrolase [Planctomycetota bacterium]